MDEQNPPEPAPGIVELVGCKQAAQPRSTFVFFGDPAQVEEALQSHFVQWGSASPDKEEIPMRSVLLLIASILAASLNTAAVAQEIDWQKVDDVFGRKAAVAVTCTAPASRAPICR